jgi:hypothetical protein
MFRSSTSVRRGYLEQPGHVPAQYPHGFQPFIILLDIAYGSSDPDIPIGRSGHDHLTNEKEMIEGI